MDRSGRVRERVSAECPDCDIVIELDERSAVECPLCFREVLAGPESPAMAPSDEASRRACERALWSALTRHLRDRDAFSTLRMRVLRRPVYVPVCRFGVEIERRGDALPERFDRVRKEIQICTAKGMPNYLRDAIEAVIRLTASPQEAPYGSVCLQREANDVVRARLAVRLGLHEVAAQDAADGVHIERALPVPRASYLYPVWFAECVTRRGRLQLAIDGLSGSVLSESWDADACLPAKASSWEHGPWFLALGSVVVAALMLLPRSDHWHPLWIALGVLSLALAVLHAQRRIDCAALFRSAARGDLVSVEESQKNIRYRQIAVMCLSGAMAAVSLLAVAFHLASSLVSADPIPHVPREERGIDVEFIRPWSSVTPNFLQSPFAVNGRVYVVTEPAPLLTSHLVTPLPSPNFSSGRTLFVGNGGFPTLADAIRASSAGDRILVGNGRFTDGRSIVTHDLLIEGSESSTIVWSGRGPHLQIGGADTRLVIRSLHFEAVNANSNAIGDPNVAYGIGAAGFHPHLEFKHSSITSDGGAGISLYAAGSSLKLTGARLPSIGVTNAAAVEVDQASADHGPLLGSFTTKLLGPGIARAVCFICVGNVDYLKIDNVSARNRSREILLGPNITRARIGPGVWNMRVHLVGDEGHEIGTLPLPQGRWFEFSVLNGVAEY